jgi:hypothetical protein
VDTWGKSVDPVARQALDEIAHGVPIADSYVLEILADTLSAKAGGGCAWAQARAAGCWVVERTDLPDGVEAVLLPNGDIVVRARRDRRRMALAILHELAHWLLQRAGIGHSHADVWCLTLALAAPCSVLLELRRRGELTIDGLHPVATVSRWALSARLATQTAA